MVKFPVKGLRLSDTLRASQILYSPSTLQLPGHSGKTGKDRWDETPDCIFLAGGEKKLGWDEERLRQIERIVLVRGREEIKTERKSKVNSWKKEEDKILKRLDRESCSWSHLHYSAATLSQKLTGFMRFCVHCIFGIFPTQACDCV